MQVLTYWIAAGENYAEVSRLNNLLIDQGPEHFIERTDSYWRAWVNKEEFDLAPLPATVAELFKKSLFIIRSNVDSNGAIIAANDSDVQHFARDTYSYMWPRDGAFTSYALDRAGYPGISRRFFEYCRDLIGRGKEAAGFFLPKYSPDGYPGSSWHPWVEGGEKHLPIQEDGTALVLWALRAHFKRYRDVEFIVDQYEKWVVRCGDFLASYRDEKTGLPLPSYDIWEERRGIHTFTVSTVYAGLRAAEDLAAFFGESGRAGVYRKAADEVKAAMERRLYSSGHKRFLRSLLPGRDGSYEPDLTIDASLYAPFYFGVFGPRDERVVSTMNAVKERLWVKTDVGGMARYEADVYHKTTDDIGNVPGNPWFLCTLWLAQWYIARAETPLELADALPVLEWAASRALPSGVLAEQVNPFTDQPLSVSPLTWSHAAFVTAVLEYLDKLRTLKG
jgi:GH15 family glucan-1,4-alpha-glucosidase